MKPSRATRAILRNQAALDRDRRRAEDFHEWASVLVPMEQAFPALPTADLVARLAGNGRRLRHPRRYRDPVSG